MNSSANKKYLTGRTGLGGRTVQLEIHVLQSRTPMIGRIVLFHITFLPAELMYPKVHLIYIGRYKWSETYFSAAEQFCRSAGRKVLPVKLIYPKVHHIYI